MNRDPLIHDPPSNGLRPIHANSSGGIADSAVAGAEIIANVPHSLRRGAVRNQIHPNRREFLAGAAAFGFVTACGGLSVEAGSSNTPLPDSTPLVGSQLYGWGQYYDREKKNVFEHLDEVFSALRDAGYDYAETSLDTGTPDNNGKLADRLRTRGLKPVSLYSGGRLHESASAEKNVSAILTAAKTCRQAGFTIINCNPDPIGREKTDEELTTQAKSLTELGNGLKALGMKLGIHHHTPEMRNMAREFHFNFEKCPADSVGFCYDVHWVFRGGVPPEEALKRYGDRVVSWHLRQSRDGIWWEDLDTGDVDYSFIADYAKKHRLPPRYTVELALEPGTKITRGVVENHRRSREFVRRTFGY
jgi:inosose dehydratase